MGTDKKKGDAYSQAVASGRYVRETGVHGKYDNVRVHWEDEVTRLFMRPYLERMVQRRVDEGKGVRIIDLGCGSGDGYELLMQMFRSDLGLGECETYLISEANLDHYRGVEINGDLLNQNAARWGENPRMVCTWGDFSDGLPVEQEEPPFDIYLTSYGALSHLNEDQTVRLFCDVARHAEDGAVLVGDWLGRYSYEWQQLWDAAPSGEQWMDYFISYIYPENQRDQVDLTPLHLRLLSREEISGIADRVKVETGIHLEVQEMFDRSVFVGRHMDTGDYNAHLKTAFRREINALFERNLRTPLDRLLIDYHPHPEAGFANRFFEQFQFCWNALIEYTFGLCRIYDEKGTVAGEPLPNMPSCPNALKAGMSRIRRVIQELEGFQMGDPRANVIEPQLAYTLRDLEMALQQGAGNGHGIVGIFTVRKP